MNLFTVFLQFLFGFTTPGIFDAMQMDLYALFMQCLDLEKNINHTAVIWGVGHIEGDDM